MAQTQPAADNPQAANGAVQAPASSAMAEGAGGSGTAAVPAAGSAPAAKPAATARATASPSWARLSPAQQRALQPLAPIWHEIDGNRRRKWLALSANFNRMSPADQHTLQKRMRDWASLSTAERNRARLNFAQTRELTPQQKRAEWQAYQSLSPERKQQLAASAARASAGAATGVTKVAPGKLAEVPVTRSNTGARADKARVARPASPRASAPTPSSQ